MLIAAAMPIASRAMFPAFGDAIRNAERQLVPEPTDVWIRVFFLTDGADPPLLSIDAMLTPWSVVVVFDF